MKQTLILLVCLFLIHDMNAQEKSQVSVGLENTEFGFAEYTYNQHWIARMTQSIFIDSPEEQIIQIAAGYELQLYKACSLTVMPQYKTGWSGKFWTAGLRVSGDMAIDRWNARLAVMPYYDSALDYKICYRGGASFGITREVKLGVDFTNIPEYRDVFDKVQFSLRFMVKNLEVAPCISVPLSVTVKRIRLLWMFKYIL